jgi:hypothetical protein
MHASWHEVAATLTDVPPPRPSRRTLVVGVAVLVVVALVAGGLVVWRWLTRTDLERALDVVPASSLRVGFTDWGTLRSELVPSLPTRPSASQIQAFMGKAYDTDLSAVSSIDESAVALQRYYGFSPANADWEAYAQSRQGATMVLKLHDADFSVLRDNLRELGYRKPSQDDGVWRGGIDLVAGIDATISPELQYVALLEDQDLVVTSDTSSYAAEAVRSAKGVDDTLLGRVDTLASALGQPANAMIWSRDFACEDLAMSKADADDQARADQLVKAAGGVDPLTGLGMAMSPKRTLQVVEQFADGEQADANVRPRARLAVGDAVGRGSSFADDFRLTSSKAVGSTVRLTMVPRAKEGFVLSTLDQGPVLFATC